MSAALKLIKLEGAPRWPHAPKALLDILADPRVDDFTMEGVRPGKKTGEHDGYWVYLNPGWNWDGVHVVHEYSVEDVRREFKRIQRCEAGCDCESW